MYLIVRTKWIRDSNQSGEFVVDSTNRIKEARGLVKHHFHSQLDVMQKHMQDTWTDFEIDEDNHWIALGDDQGIFYVAGFKVVEWRE